MDNSHPSGRHKSAFRPSRQDLKKRIAGSGPLTNLDLSHMSMKKADLQGRSLSGSDLSGSRLGEASLAHGDLSSATLDFADLSRADLRGADLTGASLVETTFWNADLRGADLSRCRNIVMANLRHSRYDDSTRWPSGLDPQTLGARHQ